MLTQSLRSRLAGIPGQGHARRLAGCAHGPRGRQPPTMQSKQAATEAHQAAEAREHAAGLAGQLKAAQEQNAALLAAIKPQGEPKPRKPRPQGAN